MSTILTDIGKAAKSKLQTLRPYNMYCPYTASQPLRGATPVVFDTIHGLEFSLKFRGKLTGKTVGSEERKVCDDSSQTHKFEYIIPRTNVSDLYMSLELSTTFL
jgi:hypothetical protein